jgi:hypothetical protein
MWVTEGPLFEDDLDQTCQRRSCRMFSEPVARLHEKEQMPSRNGCNAIELRHGERVRADVHRHSTDCASVLVKQSAHPLYRAKCDEAVDDREVGHNFDHGRFEIVQGLDMVQPSLHDDGTGPGECCAYPDLGQSGDPRTVSTRRLVEAVPVVLLP